jgi:hypothetical protein
MAVNPYKQKMNLDGKRKNFMRSGKAPYPQSANNFAIVPDEKSYW